MKKFRDELGLFVAEGDKCVEELRKGFELVSLYREGENATRTEIEQMSGLQTPQGTIGVFRKVRRDKVPSDQVRSTKENLILALDGVQNPGNLGTIIRTCDWFGVHDIVCSHDTADCYNPKVVQATMGALARVRVQYTDLAEWLKAVSSQHSDVRIYGTLLEGKDMYEELSAIRNQLSAEGSKLKAESSIIIMGNEGNGISEEVRAMVTHPIRIPSYPKDAETSESLNVSIATAIVLAEFRKGER
ncbi:MAG: RNA methyltransferase [Paludibacteraceae bacterium]|nr:RNA methyltransferase [Paludibacteraceae bacterium]MBQ8705365.1 RNA methyltransferase [Paludibacteraceae bacterium]